MASENSTLIFPTRAAPTRLTYSVDSRNHHMRLETAMSRKEGNVMTQQQWERSTNGRESKDACPSWCISEHCKVDHPEDSGHYSTHDSFPVIAPTGSAFRQQGVTCTEFIIGMRRFPNQSESWVFIGDGEDTTMSIEISLESAHRLSRILANFLLEKGC